MRRRSATPSRSAGAARSTACSSITGKQGHVAYPQLADNPVRGLVKLMGALMSASLDRGTDDFDPSNLEFTSIDIGNTTVNLIPGEARARFNIRFNDTPQLRFAARRWWSAGRMKPPATACAGASTGSRRMPRRSSPSLGRFVDLVVGAIKEATGRAPKLSTTGGTSDARFITHSCPVLEFGLVGQTMHQVDERTAIGDLTTLTAIYRTILERYFKP